MANRQQKRASKTTSRKRADTVNGNGSTEAPVFEVGDVVELPEEDGSTLGVSAARLSSLITQLGNLTSDYESKKADVMRKITEARNEYHTLVMGIGRKHNVALGPGSAQDWKYIPDRKAFERIA